MPFDDEPDDPFGFQPPLPPEDRLWRHPSEMGPAAARGGGVTVVNRPAAPTRVWLVGLVSAVLGSGLTLLGLELTGTFDEPATSPPVEVVSIPVPKQPGAQALMVADNVRPAVARVQGTGPTGSTAGTGVFFRTDGHLLTTADAVDGATSVEVVLANGTTLPAHLVGSDPLNDIAVVKTDAPVEVSATLGSPDALQVGEPAVVISSTPRPEAPVIGEGLVSGTHRRVEAGEDRWMHGMIETSVRLRVDATGAPLVDSSGSVVGILTRRGSPHAGESGQAATRDRGESGSSAEVWYATPIDWAKRLADQILLHGRVTDEVVLGVRTSDLTEQEQENLGRGAATVVSVEPGSGADLAGLERGDVIIAVDDVPITISSDLVVAVRLRQPNETVAVRYLRAGEENVALVTLQSKSRP